MVHAITHSVFNSLVGSINNQLRSAGVRIPAEPMVANAELMPTLQRVYELLYQWWAMSTNHGSRTVMDPAVVPWLTNIWRGFYCRSQAGVHNRDHSAVAAVLAELEAAMHNPNYQMGMAMGPCNWAPLQPYGYTPWPQQMHFMRPPATGKTTELGLLIAHYQILVKQVAAVGAQVEAQIGKVETSAPTIEQSQEAARVMTKAFELREIAVCKIKTEKVESNKKELEEAKSALDKYILEFTSAALNAQRCEWFKQHVNNIAGYIGEAQAV